MEEETMEIGMILLKQIVIMFVLMGIGFFLYRKKMITNAGSKDIGKILLYIVIPVVIISSFWVERTPEKTIALVESAGISAVSMFLSVWISWLLFGKKDGIGCFSSAFSNAGFIGIPLVQAVLGSDAVFYISIMIVLINALQWTLGVVMISHDKSAMSVQAIVKNPIVISVLIGLVLYGLNLPCPEMVSTLFSNIKGMNTPLAMIVSGVFLAQSDLIGMLKKKEAWIVSFFRLLVIPVIILVAFYFLPFGAQDVKLAVLIASACPVGSNVAIFAQQYEQNYTEAVEHVCLSTILCLVTLPLLVMFAAQIL
jgi:predicted permease